MNYELTLKRTIKIGLSYSAIGLIFLSGCGGGGSSTGSGANTNNQVVPPTCSSTGSFVCGTAAAGAAISGIIYAYDVNGTSSPVVTINANGTYKLDATGLTPPLMITAIGVSNLKPVIYHSIATSADLNSNLNVTPLTEVVLAIAAGMPAQDIPLASMPTVASGIPAAVSSVIGFTADIASSVGATIVNPMTDTFTANGTGVDKVLDNINVMPAKQGGTIQINLAGNNAPIGTVILPALAGGTATATPATVSAAQLTQAQKMAAVGTEINACFNSLSALYATSIPTAAQVQAFLDPNFSAFNMNASQFATYFTTAPPNGRGEVGLKFQGGGISSYDFTPPASGVPVTTPLPPSVTYDVNNNVVAFWGQGSIGGMKAGAMKIVKNTLSTACLGGWQLKGNSLPIGDVQITPAVSKQTATLGGTPVYSRGMNVAVAQSDMNLFLSGNSLHIRLRLLSSQGQGSLLFRG